MIDASLPRASPQPSSLVITADPSFTMIRLESVKSLLFVAMLLLALVKVERGEILAQRRDAKLIMSLLCYFEMMTRAKCAVVILVDSTTVVLLCALDKKDQRRPCATRGCVLSGRLSMKKS